MDIINLIDLKNKRLKIIIMKTLKTTQSESGFKFRKKRTNDSTNINELVDTRFEIKSSISRRPVKASNSLLVQMYSQENEILFI
jgi:hypothetical protein